MSSSNPEAVSRIDQWADRIGRLSRGRRMALSLAITLVLVILLSVIVDRLLIERVIEGDMGRSVPAWIAAGSGVLCYVIGWWALVGFDWNPDRPWQARAPAVYYVGAGAAGLLVLVVLIVFGLLFGYVL